MNMQGKTTGKQARVLGLTSSFGFGDRLGCATPGHLAALQAAGGAIRGIFAQQSIREMTRTQRSPEQVMHAAANALEAQGYDQPWGADADHLKCETHVDHTMAAGFVFFTIDPSDHVDQTADRDNQETIETKFASVARDLPWLEAYRGKRISLPGDVKIAFDEQTLKRAVVKYGKAIEAGIKLGHYIQQQATKNNTLCEIELSVDETNEPTSAAEHYLIVDQFLQRGVKLVSVAPRFVGTLEKGVDYIGDLSALNRSLREHAAIAQTLGPYKLSLHSGSDKLSIYPLLARATEGLFHVKTAGTSYLEALRVMAIHDPETFRRVVDFARTRYEADRATYHVHAALQAVPGPAQVSTDTDLEQLYLERWKDIPPGKGFTQAGRQILHCTFGSVLSDPELGGALHHILREHAETYKDVLVDHFTQHLQALS